MEWRTDIENAPQDTLVLAWVVDEYVFAYHLGGDWYGCGLLEPSHWMPLNPPDLPSTPS